MTNSDHTARLNKRQADALAALATTGSNREAAEQAGVNERTLRRWLNDPRFMSEYRRQSREISGRAISAVMAAQVEAVQALRAGLRDESADVRVRAASRLLDLGLKLRDVDLEARISELERRDWEWHVQNTSG